MVLPATFLPPAFKARFPRHFFSPRRARVIMRLIIAVAKLNTDGDAFCEKLAIRFFRMGDIMRYYVEKVEGT